MIITVYDCTQKSLIGYSVNDIDIFKLNEILNNKSGCLYKDNNVYCFDFDTIVRIGPSKFIVINSNMSIWCKINQKIPDNAFGDRSFVVDRG